jgi:alkylation response protein AidB-like acyl-CoA dehydrogenase
MGVSVEKWILAGESVPLESRARVRRSIAHAAECAVAAVQLCYAAAGGTAVYESAPFERALRDVNAAATHLATRRIMMGRSRSGCLRSSAANSALLKAHDGE